ncbi:heat shock protein HtpX, partial [mine drainage metagenome]
MSMYSVKLKIASILAGILIASIAAFLILGVLQYFFGVAITANLLIILLLFVFVMDIIQWLISPYIVGRAYHTKEISAYDIQYSWLIDSVKKVCDLNQQKVPRIFIANVPVSNAFAFGSPLSGRRMAITQGLLNILTKDEIEAVIGHEIGHLKHHDIG